MTNQITLAAPATTAEVAQALLASQAAQSGVVTDYNAGSQIRTLAESIGAVCEVSGISALTLALQVIAYSGMSLFDITPEGAVPAAGFVTFSTAVANPPPANTNVVIASGTLLQTLSAVVFQTTQQVTLVSGATGIVAPVIAASGGLNTNVAPNSITQILSGIPFPLSVTNTTPTSGGLNAETPTQALSRLASKLTSLVGGSPVSVANAAIGVTASGSNETVVYSVCYEGWAYPGDPNYPATAGFKVFIDNGGGSASSGSIAAVKTKLNGNYNAEVPAFRPAGVPYDVFAVPPIFANVTVSGALGPLANPSQVQTSVVAAVSGYFTLPFGVSALQPNIAAAVGNAALGQFVSLSVNLYYTSASGVPVNIVSGAPFNRILLSNFSYSVTASGS